MDDPLHWRGVRASEFVSAKGRLAEAAKGGSVNREFYSAGLIAMRSVEEDGLLPLPDHAGDERYTTQQGLKAACHAREDVAAVLMIQLAVLKRLQDIRWLAWGCLVLACYIAVRVTF